jgi:hypothetical protein
MLARGRNGRQGRYPLRYENPAAGGGGARYAIRTGEGPAGTENYFGLAS